MGTEAEFAEDINPDNIKAEATPVKGVDYYTEAEEDEWEAFIVTELAKRGQLKPELRTVLKNVPTRQSCMFYQTDISTHISQLLKV